MPDDCKIILLLILIAWKLGHCIDCLREIGLVGKLIKCFCCISDLQNYIIINVEKYQAILDWWILTREISSKFLKRLFYFMAIFKWTLCCIKCWVDPNALYRQWLHVEHQESALVSSLSCHALTVQIWESFQILDLC